MTTTEPYDEWYWSTYAGVGYERTDVWQKHFAAVADRIIAEIAPESVLDVGCAMGYLVGALRTRGVEAYGIDISDYALEHVPDDLKPFCQRQSILEPLPRQYDLIVCIEVLEHLTAEEGEVALENICMHTHDVLFSSTPTDFADATHANVQPPEYWVERFARRDFFHDVDFDATFTSTWGLRLRKNAFPVTRVVATYERRLSRLAQENDATRGELLAQRKQLAQAAEEVQAAGVAAERARTDAAEALARAESESSRAAIEWTRAESERARADKEAACAEALRRELDEAQARAADSWSELAGLRATKTFRYTEPLRRAYVSLRSRGTRSRTAEGDPLAAEFAALGPWVTRFVINGSAYGGTTAFDDPRVGWFFERFHDGVRVLELGSLEGGQTFQLAARAARVTAIEGRQENIERARFVQGLLGVENVEFVEADLERTPLTAFGKFDVVFCSGLLYHLPRPWDLIRQLPEVAPATFLWTHYASTAETTAEGVAGAWYSEHGRKDPLSGLSPRSFWPTLPELRRLLAEAGLARIEVVRDEPGHEHGATVTLAAWTGDA